MAIADGVYVHETALVESGAAVGPDTKIWHHVQVRARAAIGARCTLGKGVFIDSEVVVGDDCKLQNYACVYHGVTLGRGVFVGPGAVLTNDRHPRATDPSFRPLREGEWRVGRTHVDDGAAIGATATVLPDVRIGRWAMVGAAAVVTRDVEPYALVVGSPARRVAWVCRCGLAPDTGSETCTACGDLPEDHPLRRGPQA